MSSPNAWQRSGIGIIGLAMLLTGVFFSLARWEGAGYAQCENIAWRLSAVFALWWLAYPEFRRLPQWTWLIIPVMILLFALGSRRLVVMIPLLVRVSIATAPLLVVMWFLWRLRPRRR